MGAQGMHGSTHRDRVDAEDETGHDRIVEVHASGWIVVEHRRHDLVARILCGVQFELDGSRASVERSAADDCGRSRRRGRWWRRWRWWRWRRGWRRRRWRRIRLETVEYELHERRLII